MTILVKGLEYLFSLCPTSTCLCLSVVLLGGVILQLTHPRRHEQELTENCIEKFLQRIHNTLTEGVNSIDDIFGSYLTMVSRVEMLCEIITCIH